LENRDCKKGGNPIMIHKGITQTLCAIALLSGCVFGQSTTGTLVGIVADPADAAVPGAQVELTNNSTGAVITTKSGAEGIFRFNSLVPATYSLTVAPPAGFKTYIEANVEVTADEVRDLGRIRLALGAQTEHVTVMAKAESIQTASSENSKLIDNNQLSNITLKGRDLFGLMVTMPGYTSPAPGRRTLPVRTRSGASESMAPPGQTSRWMASPIWTPVRMGLLTSSPTWIPSPKCAC
jgi:hypothetical protein